MRRLGTLRALADPRRRAGRRSGLWALLAGAGLGLALTWLLRERSDADGIDLVKIQNLVLGLAGNADVEVRQLGDGIVELVGKVDTPERARVLVESVGEAPGVRTVLDRLWVRPPTLVS